MAPNSQLASLNDLIDKNLKRGRELFYADLEFGTETGIDEAGCVDWSEGASRADEDTATKRNCNQN